MTYGLVPGPPTAGGSDSGGDGDFVLLKMSLA